MDGEHLGGYGDGRLLPVRSRHVALERQEPGFPCRNREKCRHWWHEGDTKNCGFTGKPCSCAKPPWGEDAEPLFRCQKCPGEVSEKTGLVCPLHGETQFVGWREREKGKE